jgi:hypothetical protein
MSRCFIGSTSARLKEPFSRGNMASLFGIVLLLLVANMFSYNEYVKENVFFFVLFILPRGFKIWGLSFHKEQLVPESLCM